MVTLYALGMGDYPTGSLILTGTATTGQVLQVQRNLPLASTNSPVVCIYQQNAGDDQGSLWVTNASNAAAANPMVRFESTDAAYDQYVLNVTQAGTGGGIFVTTMIAGGNVGVYVDQNADNYGIEIDSAATTNTMYGLQVLTGAGATAANLEYTGNEFMRCVQDNQDMVWIYRNLAAASTGGCLLFVEQDEATDDQVAVKIQQDGAAGSLAIQQNGIGIGIAVTQVGNAIPLNIVCTNTASYSLQIETGNAIGDGLFLHSTDSLSYVCLNRTNQDTATNRFLRNLPAASTTAAIVRITNSNAGDDQPSLEIVNGSNGGSLFINHDDTGTVVSFDIDRDGNNAARIWGAAIAVDNAGAGNLVGGINLSSFTAGEPLLHVPVDVTAAGAYYGRIAVYVVGVGLRYIPLNA